MTQAMCGESFSIAREAATEEGVDLIKNLRYMEDALQKLRNIYFDSEKIQRVWAILRQERFKASMLA